MSKRFSTHMMYSRHHLAGVSMVELMVSMTIGLLLLVGAVSVYMQSRNTYRTTETAARIQEVARYALETVEPDLRLAGFWGMTNRTDYVTNRATPADDREAVDGTVVNNCGVNWIVDAGSFVDARDARATGGPGYNLTCSGTNPVDWADVLIVRRASSAIAAPTNGRAQIQSSRTAATIFSDGVLPPPFTAATSETRDLVVHAYYVGEVLPSPNGIRQFALRRKTLVGGGPSVTEEEIVPGVQDLQVQFGIDANRDGNVDRYVNPGDAALTTARVASVRLWLLVVAEEREMGVVDNNTYAYANGNLGTFNDSRRRVLVSKTIQIRNSPL